MNDIKKIFGDLFSLREDSASMAEIVERIHAGGVLKGTNMCILVPAIFHCVNRAEHKMGIEYFS